MLFKLLHPGITSLHLRIVGAVAIVIMLIALGVVEFSPEKRRSQFLKRLSPIFVVGTLVVIYVVLITQGSIK